MILTRTEFKDIYGIELADDKIDDALVTAHESFFNLVSKKTQVNTQDVSSGNEAISLQNWFPISKELDSDLVNSDIIIYEYDNDYNQHDRNSNIINIRTFRQKNQNRLILTFDTDLPLNSGSQIYIEFNISRLDVGDSTKVDNIKRWVGMKTFNILSKNIIQTLNQEGITSWNLNGVSVSADNASIQELVDKNSQEMNDIYNLIMPIAIETTYQQNQRLGGTFNNRFGNPFGRK